MRQNCILSPPYQTVMRNSTEPNHQGKIIFNPTMKKLAQRPNPNPTGAPL
jgi:hypothetical protein